MQHAFRFAAQEQRRQPSPITGSHDDEIAMVLIGGIDNRIVGVLMGCHYGFAGHACPRSGLLHKIKKVCGTDMLIALYVIQGNLVRVCVICECHRLEKIGYDVYSGDFRTTKSCQLYTALYGSFRMFRPVRRHENILSLYSA